MVEPERIDAAVAEIYGVVRRIWDEDVAAERVPMIQAPLVQSTDFPFSNLVKREVLNFETWAEALTPQDDRVASLADVRSLLATLTRVAPYDHPRSDGWEVVCSVALASHQFDFRSDAVFTLEDIQQRVRAVVLADQMRERTIHAVFGFHVDDTLQVGDRSWLVPATVERRSYVASLRDPHSMLIHAHCYLVTDRFAPTEDLRTGSRDGLPQRLLAALRPVLRSDMRSTGPCCDLSIILPSRFAGFKTRLERPLVPHGNWIPSDDLVVSKALADEAVELDLLLHDRAPKMKEPVRSLVLAVTRLTIAASRKDAPDSLLDLMIALEALLTQGKEEGEISYRIALRGTFAWPQYTPEERSAKRRMLKSLYNVRSAIVHGSKQDPEIQPTVLGELRDFVATIIRLSAFAISNGKNLVELAESAVLGDDAELRALHGRLG